MKTTTEADGVGSEALFAFIPMNPKLNQQVRHISGADKTGIVTAICQRSSGTQFGVTWSDLAERWHAADELVEWREAERHIGLPANNVISTNCKP